MAQNASEDPSTRSEVLNRSVDALKLINTLLNGTDAMREAATEYLPAHPNEAQQSYDNRLAKATLFNGLEDTIDNCVGRIFDEPCRIEETAPADVQEWMQDVDLKGSGLHDFGREAMELALADGIIHCLVDYPAAQVDEETDTPVALTLADERALGLRPYLTMIRQGDLISMRTQRVGGMTIVTHLRFKERIVREDGFSEEEVERIRLIEPGYWAVYEQGDSNDKGEKAWQLAGEGLLTKGSGELWGRVPVFTLRLGKRKTHDLDVKPPFLDLAHHNVRHWQSTADQYNILDTARFPMLAVSGFEGPVAAPRRDDDDDESTPPRPVPFTVGPNTVLTTGDAAGKWYYVEHTGASIKAGAEELIALEERMAIAGLEPMIAKKTGASTATESAIDEAKARAPLETWARQTGSWLESCIAAMAEWHGQIIAVKVQINTEVGMPGTDSQDIQNLIQMRLMGEISRWTFYQELMRRGLLGPNFDPTIETARMEMENPDDPGNMDGESDESTASEDEDSESDTSRSKKSARSRNRRRGRGGKGRNEDRTLQ